MSPSGIVPPLSYIPTPRWTTTAFPTHPPNFRHIRHRYLPWHRRLISCIRRRCIPLTSFLRATFPGSGGDDVRNYSFIRLRRRGSVLFPPLPSRPLPSPPSHPARPVLLRSTAEERRIYIPHRPGWQYYQEPVEFFGYDYRTVLDQYHESQ